MTKLIMMKIRKILFRLFIPFSRHADVLNHKWWHRLFKVTYILSLILVLSLACLFFIANKSIENLSYEEVKIFMKLDDFMKQQESTNQNHVSMFVSSYDNLGCTLDGEISVLSYYQKESLDNVVFCNPHLKLNIEDLAKWIFSNSLELINKDYESNKTYNDSIDILRKKIGDSHLVCFEWENDICGFENVISYQYTPLFYLKRVLYSVFTTYIVGIFLQFLYFKGFIYIIYG